MYQFLRRDSRKKILGYSLVELLITMLIGVIILNGVFHVVIASKRSELDHKEISYIQENARFALDMLSRDIRMAGYVGCANKNTDQVNVITKDVMGFIGTAGIKGFDGDKSLADFPVQYRDLAKAKTDSLLIRRGESGQEYLVRQQNPVTNTITLWANHNFEANQPLALVDGTCRYSALFTASKIDNANTLSHAVSDNNCNNVLRGRYRCDDCSDGYCPQALPSSSYMAGARIMPLISNAYFIGESTMLPGTPALKRQSMLVSGGNITTRTEELASGVENIQLLYGVDTNNDGNINEYRKASEMDVNSDGVISSDDWENVLTVKIDILLISQAPAFTTPQTVVFNGVDYIGLFMRQVVSTTIQIRNQNT